MLCALIRKSELVIWNVWVNPYRVHRKREEKTLLFTCVWTPKPPPPLGIVPECPTHLVTYKPSLQSESPFLHYLPPPFSSLRTKFSCGYKNPKSKECALSKWGRRQITSQSRIDIQCWCIHAFFFFLIFYQFYPAIMLCSQRFLLSIHLES